MGGKADLHLHTTFSDGACSPREVMARAQRAGLSMISITDHDHTGALTEAPRLAQEYGIEIIPGVELSCFLETMEVHILGYWIDPASASLQEHLALFRRERMTRAERIVGKLNGLNLPLRMEQVLAQAGSGAVGRPHIANALVEHGLTESYNEAFWRYLGPGKPAYEEKFHLPTEEAIDLIGNAGGLSFVAHPGSSMGEAVLRRLIKEGVDGIEVVHPSHSHERVAYYRGIVAQYFLLGSGGSDFHGGRRKDDHALGTYTIPCESVQAMRDRLR
jgi:hypothetical protein